MLTLLVYLIIMLLILGIAWWAITTMLPLPEPIGRILQVVFVLIAVLIIVWFLLALIGEAPRAPAMLR